MCDTENIETLIENSMCEENKCSKNEGEMGPYLHEAENLPSCSKSDTSATSSGNHVNHEDNDVECHRQNWTEFKRFKNRVKSRKYRSHDKGEEN